MRINYLIVYMIMFVFLVVSFVTNILEPIMSQVASDLHLRLSKTGTTPFAIYIAYVISIPIGYILAMYKSKFTSVNKIYHRKKYHERKKSGNWC